MDKNKLEVGVLILLMALGLGYFWSAAQLPEGSGIGPDYVPRILAVCLIILCAVKMAQVVYVWRKHPDEHTKFTVEHLPTVILVLLSLVAYFILWTVFNLFYPATFLAICGIMLICGPKETRWTVKFISIAVACAAAFLLLIYVLFAIGMDVRF